MDFEERWVKETADAVFNYVQDSERRERDAAAQNKAIVASHDRGWKLVADAITKGLGEIAHAIRDHSRR